MNKISGIYKIINIIDGKYYVGSSYDVFNRWRKHRSYLRRGKHPNDYLQNAWNKYGELNFRFEVVEPACRELLESVEQTYLDDACNNQDKSYNLSFDAECPSRNFSDASRLKMSIKAIEKFKNPSQRLKLSLIQCGRKGLSGELHPFFGHTQTPEVKLLISQSMKGKTGSQSHHYDYSKYEFYNQRSGEKFVGTPFELTTTYKLHRGNVSCLVRGIRSQHKGWIVYESKNS